MPARHERTASASPIPGNAAKRYAHSGRALQRRASYQTRKGRSSRTETGNDEDRSRENADPVISGSSPDLASRTKGFVYHVCIN